MRIASRTLLVAATLVAATAAHATGITWGSATNVNGISDISTNGTLVRALNIGSATGQLINGVTFVGNNTSGMSFDVGSGTGGLGDGGVFTGYGAPVNDANGAIDAAYGAALGTGRYVNGAGSIGTYTLTGLTFGQQYEMQLWFNDVRTTLTGDTAPVQRYDSGAATSFVDLTTDDDGLDGAGGRGALAQYVTATFTADATSQIFRVDETTGIGGATINMFQLRAVPEPSTYGLLGAGALAAVAFVRRRRKA